MVTATIKGRAGTLGGGAPVDGLWGGGLISGVIARDVHPGQISHLSCPSLKRLRKTKCRANRRKGLHGRFFWSVFKILASLMQSVAQLPPPQTWQGWPHKRTRSACISERQCRGGMSVTGVQGPRSDPVPLRGPVLNENSQCHRPRARRFQSESVLVMTKSKPCRADQGCRGLRTKRQGVGLCRGPPGTPG